MCKAICSMKRVTYKESNIVQLETTFRDRALTWHMKYKAIALEGQKMSLAEMKRDVLR
jgi:hypothetical protein